MASIKVPDLLPPNKPSESGRVQVPDFEGPVAEARSAVLSPPKTLDGLVSTSLLNKWCSVPLEALEQCLTTAKDPKHQCVLAEYDFRVCASRAHVQLTKDEDGLRKPSLTPHARIGRPADVFKW